MGLLSPMIGILRIITNNIRARRPRSALDEQLHNCAIYQSRSFGVHHHDCAITFRSGGAHRCIHVVVILTYNVLFVIMNVRNIILCTYKGGVARAVSRTLKRQNIGDWRSSGIPGHSRRRIPGLRCRYRQAVVVFPCAKRNHCRAYELCDRHRAVCCDSSRLRRVVGHAHRCAGECLGPIPQYQPPTGFQTGR